MGVFEILGFQGLVYVLLVLGFVVIRQVWRNAEAKKEEIMRLVQDTAMAEMEASTTAAGFASASASASIASVSASFDLDSLPVSASQGYQCAVCYSPTTMRCSRCKAVRYCSGKCQISHWRQGHKDECCPLITTTREVNGGNITCRASVAETQFGLHEIKGKHVESYNAARKSFGDNCHATFTKPVCNNTADDTCIASTDSDENETVLPPSSRLESKSPVNIEVRNSSSSKRSKKKSSNTSDEVGFKSKVPKTKSDTSHDLASNLSGHEHRRKVASVEKSIADTSKCKTVPSLSNSNIDVLAGDVEESHLSRYKEARRSSSNSRDRLFSTTKGDSVSHSMSTKTDNYHSLPSKVSAAPNPPQNVRNGLKSSMQKVVQQFRISKGSRSNLISVENELGCPYELFVELYCYDKVKLFPFGLTNCGNDCYANTVLQCLAYTRPLTSYLLQGFHSKRCQKKGCCFICEFEYLIQKAKEGNSPLSPIGILSKIHKIGSHLGHGREEDAHEFLRGAVDTMQSICLKEASVSSPLTEETTLIGYTFGGYLRSKKKCLRCLGKSEMYERMMDLTVEIGGNIETLEEALG